MWDLCVFLAQLAVCVFIIDCIFQMLKDFVPSGKTIFGVFAVIAGLIGLSHLKSYLDEKDAQKRAGEEIKNDYHEEESN